MVNIRYVKHTDIDKVKWDACIHNAPNGLIYAYSYYLDIMSKNWDALILSKGLLSENDYEAVMPLTQNKKFGISYLRQPAFTQQLGIFGHVHFDNDLTEQFINKALELFLFIEINLNYANEYKKGASQILANWWRRQPGRAAVGGVSTAHIKMNETKIWNAPYKKFPVKKCNLILDLNQPFEVIKKSFRSDLVKKATSAHLIYKPSDNIEEAIKLFKHNYSKKIPHVTEKNYEALLQLCVLLKSKEQLLVRKVNSSNGNLLSITIFFKDNRRIYYILSTTLPGGRDYDANAFLLHEVIKEFSNQKLLFDFEGSDIPSIQFFLKKFGPAEQPYHFVRINKLPFLKRWIKKIYNIYKYSSKTR